MRNKTYQDGPTYRPEPFDIPGPFDLFHGRYPHEYEGKMLTKDGTLICIRPIKPEDAPLLVQLFNSLSPASVYFRFLRRLESLPPEMVTYFTRIDYERDVAMVALKRTEHEEEMLGVCRIMRYPDSTKGEVAVVVADRWHGQGIGHSLLERSVRVALDLGMRSLWAIVSPENTTVLSMAEKMGFSVRKDPETDTYELEMDLAPGQ